MNLQLFQNVQYLDTEIGGPHICGCQQLSLASNAMGHCRNLPKFGGTYYLLLQGEVLDTLLSDNRTLALNSIHHEEIPTWYNEHIRI